MAALDEITRTFGLVPNLFQTYAKYPPLLEANWVKVKAVLFNGSIRRKAKEAIALLVSHDNNCGYCVAAHSAALRGLGVNEAGIASMLKAEAFPGLSDVEIALVHFARKVNYHWLAINDEYLESLRQLGVGDNEMIEVIGVVELFAGFNRFARVMRVPVDF